MTTTSPLSPESPLRRAAWPLRAAGLAVVAAAVLAPGTASASASASASIADGSQGAAVRTWQADLDRVQPSADLAIDGVFGPLTRQATDVFQADAHIGVDGIVGPLTSAAMTKELEAPTVRPCTTAQLHAALGPGDGAAGSTYVPLALTNISATPCVTGGYPGVSYVTGSAGTQVGAPAVRAATVPARSIILAAGQTATATLREVDAGNFPSCGLTPTRGLRVYPPNQRTALFVAQPGQGCAHPAVADLYTTAFQRPA
jgi:peptidoglycan hydrolase-like protein with peptidoglycan-binding domain